MIHSLLNWLFQDEKMIQEWNEKFPNKCIVCSYHSYGYANGMTSDPNPPIHDCTYAKKSTNTPVLQ